ncbi:MAG: DEAD/DEAH box helicase [Ectothiorhodospiraceae bacterium]|nr:DEAD/DEAH box helicase [Chromatiales bacterium]MCP5154068.1 DEAD/DEAH box helicase [Ectothiorhodospiraceae bacterium]
MPGGPVSAFAELGLPEAITRAVDAVGYETPSPIQGAAIGPLLAGRDLLGQAQTGTGKTAAFALPLLARIDTTLATPQLLVLTPTRELAIQVAEAIRTYARFLPALRVLAVYGGQSLGAQLPALRRGTHVVVGTPGRVLDHLRRDSLRLDGLRAAVLDEADEMLRMGFIEDVETILGQTPEGRQLALFSATMPPAIRAIARRHTRDPHEIRIESRTATVSTVGQRYWQVAGLDKAEALTRILEVEDFDAMVVFVRTKTATVTLAERLEAAGFSSAPLNGDMSQAVREATIDRFRNGRLDILVATDVAARGLDVERISHVVNFDVPYDVEAYVHRIGRTARAGRAGEAILFVSPRERRMLRAIERAIGQSITPMSLPSLADISARRIARFEARLTEALARPELEAMRAVVAGFCERNAITPDAAAAGLALLAQGDRPLLLAEPEPERPAARPERRVDREPPADRDDATRAPRRPSRGELGAVRPDCVRYRIEVGSTHGVQPKNIVGAIANEAGLESRHIGPIRIHDDHSTVDLPKGMGKALFAHLKRVIVCGRPMRISVVGDERERGRGRAPRPRPHGRPGAPPRAARGKPRAARRTTARTEPT